MAEDRMTVGGASSQSGEKLIGVDSDGFESMLLYGCLGFGLSVSVATLVLVNAVLRSSDKGECGIVLMLAALVTCAFLWLAQRMTDRLQTRPGRIVLAAVHTIGLAGSSILMMTGMIYSAVLCACLGFASALLGYGRFLVVLVRKALMTVVDIVFMYAGAMVLILSQMSHATTIIVIGLPAAVAIMVYALLTFKDEPFETQVDRKDSRNRSIKVRGNNHTLVQLGFMLGTFLLSFFALPVEEASMALGFATILSGVFSLMLRHFNEKGYREPIKRVLAFAAALLLLPVAIVEDYVRVVLFVTYMCIAGLNIIVLVNAVIETSRFNMISSVYLLGQEGAVFFAGVFAGALVSCISLLNRVMLEQGFENPLLLTCMLAVVLIAYMQIRVNYQVYPLEPVIETRLDEQTQETIEHEGHRKTVWRRKREIACERYGLSPREREILQILLKGRDAKYIMDTFYISQSTAKTHIYNIYRKFGIHSRQELLDFIEDIEIEPGDELELSTADADDRE